MVWILVRTSCLAFLLCLSFILSPPVVFCQQSNSLRVGINEYKEENYEEAVEALIKARNEDPKSSVAAFFLGLTYKQVMDYPKAFE